MGPYMPMSGYYGQYPQAHLLKPGENGHFYSPYLAPVPQTVQLQPPSHGASEDHSGYLQQYYPTFMPFASPPVYPYMVPRQDGQTPSNYMVFSIYPKSIGGPDLGHGGDAQDGGDHGATDKSG
jgi:hypothetical protein